MESWEKITSPHLMDLNSIPTCPITDSDISNIKKNLFENIATKDKIFTKISSEKAYISLPGAVIASPSRLNIQFSQDYFFHWIRDAAIVMNELSYLYTHSVDKTERDNLMNYFIAYIYWNKIAQQQSPVNGINILGEPKYNIDATVWHGDWARPQNDGPALRALSLINIANILLDIDKKDIVTSHLFNKHLEPDKMGIIKIDLEYIAHNWNFATAGLWEEVMCYHFFTEAVQRNALINGAKLAVKIGDNDAADFYLKQAKSIEKLMDTHWNNNRGYYAETLQYHDSKGGGLNSAIILGIIYGQTYEDDDFLAIDNPKSISSAYYIRYAFEGLYPINIRNRFEKHRGPLIGRYPDDIYDGHRSFYGNPWILTSAMLAKFYFILARILLNKEKIEISPITYPFYQELCTHIELKTIMNINFKTEAHFFWQIIYVLLYAGDTILATIKHHSRSYGVNDDFHLSEQIDRSSGLQVSAYDLTWSYSTVLSAYRSRQSLIHLIESLQNNSQRLL